MAPGAVDELLDHSLGQIDPISRRRLHRLAAGNPLLLRELLGDATETGVLQQREEVWRWRGPVSGSPRVTEQVAARLRAMEPATRQVLELIACGEPLSLSLLEHLADPAAIEAAERSGMAVIEPSGSRTALRLAHPLYGETLRVNLPASRARAIWSGLADALAESPMRRRDDVLLAGLWQLRSGVIRHPELLPAAARQAITRFDMDLAERLARAARGAGCGWEADWLLARILHFRTRSAEALEVLPAEAPAGGKHAAMWAIARAGILYWGLGRIEEAEHTLRAVPEDTPGRDLADATRSWILFYDGRCRAAVAQGVLDRAAVSDRAVIWAAQGGAAAAGILGKLGRATAIVERGRTAAGAHGDRLPWGKAQVGYGLCYALRAAGQLHRALTVADEGYRAAVASDAGGMAAVWAGFRGVVAKAQGRLDQAEPALREAIALVEDETSHGRSTWIIPPEDLDLAGARCRYPVRVWLAGPVHRQHGRNCMLLTKRFRRAAALIVLAIATALSIAAAPAASADPGPANVQPQSCGYSMDPHFHVAFYNHCTSDGSHIWIRVERYWPYNDYDQCVGPGTTGLGPAPPIYSAWYKGTLC